MKHLKPPEPLLLSQVRNKSEAWRQWKMCWDLYKVASGLDEKDEKIQVATLLHVLGKECVEIFSNFTWSSEDDKNKISVVENKFKEHCEPLTSKNFNRHLFLERKQRENETVDEFCSALKTLAKNADLGNREESWITSLLVLGLKDLKLKERLMEKDRTLEETLQAARIAETSKQHIKSMGANAGKMESVDAVPSQRSRPWTNGSLKGGQNVKSGSGRQEGKYCENCGRGHLPGDCVAAGRRCHNCHLLDHFARFCPKKAARRKQVNTLSESDNLLFVEDSDSDFESLFVGAVNNGQSKDWTETVDFGNIQIVFKLDTGAQCNVLPKCIYDRITSEPLPSPSGKSSMRRD